MSKGKKVLAVCSLLLGAGLLVAGYRMGRRPPPPSVTAPRSLRPPERQPRAHAPVARFELLKERSKSHHLKPDEQHVYFVDLQSDQFLGVTMRQRGMDIRLDLFDPAGRPLLTVDTPNGNESTERLLWIAETPGTFQVVVSASDKPAANGGYVIESAQRRRAREKDRRNTFAIKAYYQAKSLVHERGWASWQAAEALATAAVLLDGVGNVELGAYAWADLGRAHLKQYRWHKAVDADQRAALLFRRLGSKAGEAVATAEVAQSEQRIPDIAKAREHFERARQLAHEAGDETTETTVLVNLGLLSAERADAWNASASLEAALLLARKRKDADSEARAMTAMGLLYTQMGQIEKALGIYRAALGLRNVSLGVRAKLLTQMGNALVYWGRPERAFQFFQRALGINQLQARDLDNEASTLVGFGLAYVASRSFSNAVNSYQRALRVFQYSGDLRGQAITLMNIGWALGSLARYEEAVRSFALAFGVARKLQNKSLEAGVLLGYAWTERRRRHLNEAQRQAERSLELVEALRSGTEETGLRISFFSSKQDVYQLLIGILMDRYETEKSKDLLVRALEIAESARARGLLDNLGMPRPGSTTHAAGQQHAVAASVLTAKQIQANVLDSNTLLLEYALGEPKSYLWLVTTEEIQAFELPSGATIEALAKEVYERLAKSHLGERRAEAIAKARELSQMLLGPVAGRLGGKRLLIVGSGALQSIPFAALPDPAVSSLLPTSDRPWPEPLVLRHEILYEPSASVLAEVQRMHSGRPPAAKLLAVLADPVFERDDPRIGKVPSWRGGGSDQILGPLKRLPATRREADAITAGLPAEKVLKALDFSASRALVTGGRLKEYRIIHIATHSFYQARQPELISLVLSRFDRSGRPQEGLLRIADILPMELRSDLVVLSSCSSAMGPNMLGEGLMGLPQAFLTAGSAGVVMSLWDVGDRSTAELMQHFYRNILTRRMSASGALREAQVAMWRDSRYNAPWFWAAFIAQGDWEGELNPSLNKNRSGVSSSREGLRSQAATKARAPH